MRGWPASTSRCANPCRPAARGDDDLAEVARLSGVTALHGTWRYPEPLAPAAAAERAGMALPTRDELVASVAAVDGRKADPGRGRGRPAGRARRRRGDAARPRARPGRAGAGRRRAGTRHAEPHRADTGSACCARNSMCGTGDRRVAARTGCGRDGQSRRAGPAGRRCAAVLPAGAGSLSAAEFETMSAAAFDAQWVASLVG